METVKPEEDPITTATQVYRLEYELSNCKALLESERRNHNQTVHNLRQALKSQAEKLKKAEADLEMSRAHAKKVEGYLRDAHTENEILRWVVEKALGGCQR